MQWIIFRFLISKLILLIVHKSLEAEKKQKQFQTFLRWLNCRCRMQWEQIIARLHFSFSLFFAFVKVYLNLFYLSLARQLCNFQIRQRKNLNCKFISNFRNCKMFFIKWRFDWHFLHIWLFIKLEKVLFYRKLCAFLLTF